MTAPFFPEFITRNTIIIRFWCKLLYSHLDQIYTAKNLLMLCNIKNIFWSNFELILIFPVNITYLVEMNSFGCLKKVPNSGQMWCWFWFSLLINWSSWDEHEMFWILKIGSQNCVLLSLCCTIWEKFLIISFIFNILVVDLMPYVQYLAR